MVQVASVRESGNQLVVVYDNGDQAFAVPTGQGLWMVQDASPDVSDPTPDPNEPVEHPAPAPTPSNDPDPVTETSGIYNPWKSYTITGTWADHMSYSLGGIDYPLRYGTGIKAPASGTLTSRAQGGFSDWGTGWVGSAGRRSILRLDDPVPRVSGRAMQQGEGSGSLVAVVFQHQSVLGRDGHHYDRGQVLGKSGASADRRDYGGDVHLHVHGLNADGRRVNLLNFIP